MLYYNSQVIHYPLPLKLTTLTQLPRRKHTVQGQGPSDRDAYFLIVNIFISTQLLNSYIYFSFLISCHLLAVARQQFNCCLISTRKIEVKQRKTLVAEQKSP